MSAIDDLIAQIEDRALRERLKIETAVDANIKLIHFWGKR